MEHDDKLADALEKVSDTVKRSEISPVLFQFAQDDQTEFLLMDGHPTSADVTYTDIYSKATTSIYLVDNYISLKTLRLLQDVKPGVQVTVFSDNAHNKLHASDLADFHVEFPAIPIAFQTTAGKVHDRYIILDYGEPGERIFLCGSSSKDAGRAKMSTIVELQSADMRAMLHAVVEQMRRNPPLMLR